MCNNKECLDMCEMTKNFLKTGDPGKTPVVWINEFLPILVSRGVPTEYEINLKMEELGLEERK